MTDSGFQQFRIPEATGRIIHAATFLGDETLLVGIHDGEGQKHEILALPLDGQDRELGDKSQWKALRRAKPRVGQVLSYDFLPLENQSLAFVMRKSVQVVDAQFKKQFGVKHGSTVTGVAAARACGDSLLTMTDDSGLAFHLWDLKTGKKSVKKAVKKLFEGAKKTEKYYWRQFLTDVTIHEETVLVSAQAYKCYLNKTEDMTHFVVAFNRDYEEQWRQSSTDRVDKVSINSEGIIRLFGHGLKTKVLDSSGAFIKDEESPCMAPSSSLAFFQTIGDDIFAQSRLIGGNDYRVHILNTKKQEATSFGGVIKAVSRSGRFLAISEGYTDWRDNRQLTIHQRAPSN